MSPTPTRIETMVRHWVDHLQDHIEEFERWRSAAEPHVNPEVVSRLDEARKHMASARNAMRRAAQELEAPGARVHDEQDP